MRTAGTNKRKKDKPGSGGFTLVELVIAVTVLVILLALAYPAYQNQVIEARRADGKALLYEAAQREQQFFSENGSFTATVGSTGLELETSSEKGYYTLSVAATATSYTLTATRVTPQTADTECGDLTLTHLNVKGCSAEGCDVDRCW